VLVGSIAPLKIQVIELPNPKVANDTNFSCWQIIFLETANRWTTLHPIFATETANLAKVAKARK
jgi:hypothetical protein